MDTLEDSCRRLDWASICRHCALQTPATSASDCLRPILKANLRAHPIHAVLAAVDGIINIFPGFIRDDPKGKPLADAIINLACPDEVLQLIFRKDREFHGPLTAEIIDEGCIITILTSFFSMLRIDLPEETQECAISRVATILPFLNESNKLFSAFTLATITNERTPLQPAALKVGEMIVQMMLERKVDPKTAKYAASPFAWALMSHSISLMESIADKDPQSVLKYGKDGSLPLHIAACQCCGDQELRIVLEAISKVTKETVSIDTPNAAILLAEDDELNPMERICYAYFSGAGQCSHPGRPVYFDSHIRTLRTAIDALIARKTKVPEDRSYLQLGTCIDRDMKSGKLGRRLSMVAAAACGDSSSNLDSIPFVHQMARCFSFFPSQVTSDLLELLLIVYEDSIKTRDEQGRLPLHYALMRRTKGSSRSFNGLDVWSERIRDVLSRYPKGLTETDNHGCTPLHYFLGQAGSFKTNKPPNEELVTHLIAQCPPVCIQRRSDGLYPFAIAATNPVFPVSTIFELLRKIPDVLRLSRSQ